MIKKAHKFESFFDLMYLFFLIKNADAILAIAIIIMIPIKTSKDMAEFWICFEGSSMTDSIPVSK